MADGISRIFMESKREPRQRRERERESRREERERMNERMKTINRRERN